MEGVFGDLVGEIQGCSDCYGLGMRLSLLPCSVEFLSC